jgi:predicted acylesterase/phospholipase RssA
VWRAARASISLPGIFLPAIQDGRLLVDGGVLDNLPGGIMRERFAGPLIAVSASPSEDFTARCEEFPSPWRVLVKRLLRFTKTPYMPSILDVLVRSVNVGSIPRARQVQQDADLFLAPPIQKYGMMQFEAMEAIANVGYRHAAARIEKFKKSATYKELMGIRNTRNTK